MVSLMREITGREPEMWGTIVGFGACHYRYPTGTEGDMPVAAFAPRKQATTVYLMDTGAHGDELAKLGPHDTGVGCLYIKDLEAVESSVRRLLRTGTGAQRQREAFAIDGMAGVRRLFETTLVANQGRSGEPTATSA